MDTLTIEEVNYLAYEYLMSQAEELKLDSSLENFRETIYEDITNFEESYPEIVSKYQTINNIRE